MAVGDVGRRQAAVRAARGRGSGDSGLQGGPGVVFKGGEAAAAPTWGGGRAAAVARTLPSPAAARDGEAMARAGRPGSAGLRPTRAHGRFKKIPPN